MIYLTVYVTERCNVCKRVVTMLKEFSSSEESVHLKILDVQKTKKQISIVPAVFINNKLYAFGDINIEKLKQKIKAKQL